MNFNAGGAAINALSRVAGADLSVVDVGTLSNPAVRHGTRNFVREPAMTEEEVDAAIEVGRSEVRRLEGVRILGLGEMGIGNTTAASAMTAALTGLGFAVRWTSSSARSRFTIRRHRAPSWLQWAVSRSRRSWAFV